MQVPGFIGANVGQRTQIQARQSFSQKINSIEAWRKLNASRTDEEKRVIKDAWKIKKENLGLRLEVLKTADELQDLLDKWVLNIYEQEKHGSLGISPVMKWNRCPISVKSIPDPSILNLLLGESFTRKVLKKGVAVGPRHHPIELRIGIVLYRLLNFLDRAFGGRSFYLGNQFWFGSIPATIGNIFHHCNRASSIASRPRGHMISDIMIRIFFFGRNPTVNGKVFSPAKGSGGIDMN
jgi:hypothetical protein